MRILHSKSTSEPILLVSACHGMNVLAVVTASSATVYRSTTLTVVASLSLTQETHEPPQPPCTSDGGRMQASWSPSGRIFTLALPSGVILLLDVEDGSLVRRLVPREAHVVPRSSPLSSGKQTDKVAAENNNEEDDTSTDPAQEAEEEDEEEEARKLSCAAALQAAPSIPLSIPRAPVVSMTWTTIAQSGPNADQGARALEPRSHAETTCLPLPPILSQPLLEEAEPDAAKSSAAGIAFLIILGANGAVSIVAGGLQEVCAQTLGVAQVGGVVADQFVIASRSSGNDREVSSSSSVLPMPSLLALSVQELLAVAQCAKQVPHNAELGEGTSGEAGALAQLQRHLHRRHSGFLVSRPAVRATSSSSSGNPEATPGCRRHHFLQEIDFQEAISRLTARDVPVLCRVAEYCRTAFCCLQNAHRQWQRLIHGRIWPHLQLPHSARLLRDIVVEAVALPDEQEVAEYYAGLDREALADDLFRVALTLSVLANDVYNVCYRAFELSFTLVAELRDAQQLFSQRTTGGAELRTTYERFCGVLAGHRRYGETFLQRIRHEGGEVTNIITFALQRASLMFDLPGGTGEVDEAGHPVNSFALGYAAEALPAAKHPSLLATLERITRAATTMPPDEPDLESTFSKWSVELESLVAEALALSTTPGVTSTRLSCRSVAMGPDGDSGEESRAWYVDLECPRLNSDAGDHGGDTADESNDVAQDETALATVEVLIHAVGASCSVPQQEILAESPMRFHAEPVPRAVSASAFVPVDLDADPTIRAVLPSVPTLAWYSRLDDDHHLLLYVSAKEGGATPSDGFTLVAVDNEGHVKVREGDDDDEADGDGIAAESEDGDGAGGGATRAAAGASYMTLEVKGMEVTADSVMVSVSKGRQFCVVAACNRFVVIDLFEE